MHRWIHGHKAAAAYCDVSPETWKRLQRLVSFRRVRLPTGAILFRTDWIDAALEQFEQTGNCCGNGVDALVEGVLRDFEK